MADPDATQSSWAREASASGAFEYDAPEISAFEGGHLDHKRSVEHAEDLQDYRREQEGTLIMRDDRALLVMAFGTKYVGANEAKYMHEGKYSIPVGYKCIIKWAEDEIIFMSRRGAFGPEYQIIYLPKSAVADDFTLLEWNANIHEIWDMLLSLLWDQERTDEQERDMQFFMHPKGPWYIFGIMEDAVQIAVEKNLDEKTDVDRILYCQEGNVPSFHEYSQYLGWQRDTDEEFRWIVEAFRNEQLPEGWALHVLEKRAYFVFQGKESVWPHPLHEKYSRMLNVARQERPVQYWRSIVAFQIEFLFRRKFTLEHEIANSYPPVQTVENTIEMARIYNVDLAKEPYLAHILKRALRHYADQVKKKRSVADVYDFWLLMSRYKEVVAAFTRAKNAQAKQVAKIIECVACPEGDKETARVYCDTCQDLLCEVCFDRLHQKGRRQEHKRTWVELGICIECEDEPCWFHCVQCQDAYCKECFMEFHLKGGRRNHVPIVLRSFNKEKHKIPATAAFDDGHIHAAGITIGSGSATNLAKSFSPWVAFEDDSQIPIYYNLETMKSQRDRPNLLNEPIEDILGGGFSGGWAGSFLSLENENADA